MTLSTTNAADIILPLVAKPGRYRSNFTPSDPARFGPARLKALVVHPDLFEPGFSDLTTRDAHAALNALPGVAADLAFLPWPDLEELLRGGDRPLWGIETGWPPGEFDLIVFTPKAPLQFVNVLRLLDLMRLPRRAADRSADAPLVLAAGDALLNPMPLAPALDAALLGDPWAGLPELARALSTGSASARAPRAERRAALAGRPGLLLFEGSPGPVRPVALAPGGRPEGPVLTPLVQIEDEAWPLIIRRGGAGHRFVAGWSQHESAAALPVDDAVERVSRAIESGGFERVRLTGDHPAHHPELARLAEGLMRRHPSLILTLADFGLHQPGPALARELLRGRRVTLTWSPWAGSARLRQHLGVEGDESTLLEAVSTALRGGASTLNFRFGLGWPGESDADRQAIAEMVAQIRGRFGDGAAPRVLLDLSPFTPRPHTAFELEGMITAAEWEEALAALRRAAEQGPVQLRPAPYDLARLDGALARGGDEWFRGLEAVVDRGGRTPLPTEPWRAEPWLAAMAGAGLDLEAANAPRSSAGPPPWAVVDLAGAPRLVDLRAGEPSDGAAGRPGAAVESVVFGRRTRRKPAGASAPRQSSRYRIRFAKEESFRFTAHLDVGKAIERCFRRLGIGPAARGKGVQLSFGPPLPLGWTSDDEYFDIEFAQDVPEATPQMLADLLPPGLTLLELKPVRASVESLSQSIDRAAYRISFPAPLRAELEGNSGKALADCLRAGIDWALAEARIDIPRNPAEPSITMDVRPGLLAADIVSGPAGDFHLHLRLTIGAPGSVRPDMLLPLLARGVEFDARRARIHRLALRISGANREFSPLEVVEANFPWWREAMKKNASGQRP